ncbi:MAG: PqqD family protein [Actinomycetota bacterium]|nr:PqqD family protein [Actinomycetota bacterium]
MNKTGSVLWQAVARGATRRELIELLVQRYELDEEAAGAHVDDFVSALARSGVLDTP